ncbi:MAG: discoidin domain-containing protein, partial [Clostridiales bacterium]|nr:discoidin domain-containing protein [Clostridiales bacterium]
MKNAKKIICCILAVFLLCSFGCSGCNGCKRKKGEDEQPPVKEGFGIYGVADTSITAGKFFNVMEGITAKTESGEDITANITVSGELDTSRAGTYTLTYSVRHQGESESIDRRITVVANPAVGQEPPTFIYEAEEAFNIAKGCAATATETDNASAGNAVDGGNATRWESNHFGAPIEGEHIVNYTVDLGEVLPVEGVVIDWESAYAKRFALLVSSDGRTYQTLQEVEDNAVQMADNHGLQAFSFNDAVSARYVRLQCIERVTVFGYSVWELQVLGKKGTVIPEESYPVLYQAKNEQARDWKTEREEEIVFDLGGVRSVGAFTLSWLSYLTPASFNVLYSANGTDYTPVGLVNQPYSADSYYFYAAGGNPQEYITLAARYVKVQMHALRFYVPSYRITGAAFRENASAEKYAVANVTASSAQKGHEAAFM